MAEKSAGKWRVFTGNELGALFGWWAVQCWRRNGAQNPDKTYMLASTVSSKILDTIAKKEGIHFEDTLTGEANLTFCIIQHENLFVENLFHFFTRKSVLIFFSRTVIDSSDLFFAP